jgi:mono/diheme cytochrome c family protein
MARGLLAAAALATAVAFAAPPAGNAQPVSFLDQGWSKDIRERFYFTPQGSRIIPYAWFKALETPDGSGLFADATFLRRYGLLPADGAHPLNPGMLPIGFALDPVAAPGAAPGAGAKDGPQLGITCAACHTAQVTVEGRAIRIDGGPAAVDFDSFYADLSVAVARTVFDPARFQRFAARVLTAGSAAALAELQQDLAAFQARLAGDAAVRHAALASGFGRVDALAQIVNALAVTSQGDPRNLRLVNAPTSYPPLWMAPELEFVQWSPIAASPIGRNGGEVMGVFGTTSLTGDQADWFRSSLLIRELHALEAWVKDLAPPKWDEAIFGRIDRDLATKGEGLFRRHCAACHNMAPYRRTDPAANFFGKSFIAIGRIDYKTVGTDPLYIESLAQRLVHTSPATAQILGGRTVVPAAEYFLRTVGAVVSRAMDEAGVTNEERTAMHGFRFRKSAAGQPELYYPDRVTDLKASPLAAVWATGPYLHNGSVPTVYELLSPEAERRKVFWTGGRELDRERLGFAGGHAPGRFRFDTSLPGNRNTGHAFPRQGLGHDDRMAVIEYLKTQ